MNKNIIVNVNNELSYLLLEDKKYNRKIRVYIDKEVGERILSSDITWQLGYLKKQPATVHGRDTSGKKYTSLRRYIGLLNTPNEDTNFGFIYRPEHPFDYRQANIYKYVTRKHPKEIEAMKAHLLELPVLLDVSSYDELFFDYSESLIPAPSTSTSKRNAPRTTSEQTALKDYTTYVGESEVLLMDKNNPSAPPFVMPRDIYEYFRRQ